MTGGRGMRMASAALLLAVLAATPAAAQAPPVSADAARVLLDQANFWMTQNQPEQAQLALERLLRLEPRNADALALQAQLQADRGDRGGALASLALLRQLRPDDPRLAGIEQTLRAGTIDPAGLAEARQLAREGHGVEAVARYQRLFRGAPPPGSLALEYYQTLGGTPGGWDPAREGLAELAANPQDQRARLAYFDKVTLRILKFQVSSRNSVRVKYG